MSHHITSVYPWRFILVSHHITSHRYIWGGSDTRPGEYSPQTSRQAPGAALGLLGLGTVMVGASRSRGILMERAEHPYRAPFVVALQRSRPLLKRLSAWLHGDDGRVWVVTAEPSLFRADESVLLGPFTRREARRAARAFVAAHPHGEAVIVPLPPGSPWPPRCNRCPANFEREKRSW